MIFSYLDPYSYTIRPIDPICIYITYPHTVLKASYGVEDPEYAVSQLAQTTMRSEIGKLSLDTIFRERTSLNESIVEAINQAANVWGIACLRYEISMYILGCVSYTFMLDDYV